PSNRVYRHPDCAFPSACRRSPDMHIRSIHSLFLLPLLAACGSTNATDSVEQVASQTQALTEPSNAKGHEAEPHGFKHVLLLSIDGLHQVDLAKFTEGHPKSALAKLARRGVQYTQAFVNRLEGKPSNPSDSFPGLLALTTGGSSPTHGGWYDVSYSR